MVFQQERVVELVTEFYRSIGLEESTRITVRSNLDAALKLATHAKIDTHFVHLANQHDWAAWTVHDLDDEPLVFNGPHHVVLRHVFDRAVLDLLRFLGGSAILTAENIDAVPEPLAEAFRSGLGWLIAAQGKAILVPTPVIRVAEGRSDVLHDDTGRMAVVWPDGHGYYFLHGIEFTKRRYFQIIDHVLLIQDIAELDNADQRAIALQYMTFEQLVIDSDATLLDLGVKGTALYQLALPPRLARDRPPGYGGYDYFIHMHDASHPEREFIEWVDPEIGRLCNAELCQAHAFGISLGDWLAVEQQG
ncbi:hypothetical protein [Mycobacteroides abscessus]|uniref:hypothetical protein n=1 Tax=Mycobacteroides abscessus TaxID=36809 RepID=UPI002106908B|nr:hypothetical protein [Mycobacteroides abscessus]